MLIPNQIVTATWHVLTRKHYEKLGFNFTRYGDSFQVRVDQLSFGSRVMVAVQCDYCEKEYSQAYVSYRSYVKEHEYNSKVSCMDCRQKKSSETAQIRYGSYSWACITESKKHYSSTMLNRTEEEKELSNEKRRQTIKTKGIEIKGRRRSLSKEQVLQILDLKFKEKKLMTEIVKIMELDVSTKTISKICNGFTYKEITIPYLESVA